MSTRVWAYIDEHREQWLADLQALLRFSSISAQPAHKKDVADCAQWLANYLNDAGLAARVVATGGHPIVIAEYTRPDATRTLNIYGHYDVQPVDPLDQWHTPPFELTIKDDGYLYGRGATDDKGQLFAHVIAVAALLKTEGKLPCNVRFLLEGEEESNGDALERYVKQHRDDLACDAVVISDGSMYDARTPAITYGLRGLAGFQVTLRGPCRDLHSGSFGGVAANPALVLARLLSECLDADGRVTIPGFYDEVRPLEAWERENFAKLAFDEAALARELGVPQLAGEPGYDALARKWARPTFEVNGMVSGYTGPGGKTIIPATASAKITMRLVPDQEPSVIAERAVAHLRARCPETVTLEISPPFGARPVLTDIKHPIVQAAAEALHEAFGQSAALIRQGGTIPVAGTFGLDMGWPTLLMGFGLSTDNTHSPNERFRIESLFQGTKASAALMARLG